MFFDEMIYKLLLLCRALWSWVAWKKQPGKLFFFCCFIPFSCLACPTGPGTNSQGNGNLMCIWALLEDGIVLKRGLKSKSKRILVCFWSSPHFKRKKKKNPRSLTSHGKKCWGSCSSINFNSENTETTERQKSTPPSPPLSPLSFPLF